MDIFEKLKQLSAQRENNSAKPEYIIVGLGNPGIQYQGTRHNAGFITIEMLEKKLGFSCDRHKFKAKVGNTVIGGKSCLVMKPETFMNLSGEFVRPLMEYFKIAIEDVVIIYDDMAIAPGKIRLRLCQYRRHGRPALGVFGGADPDHHLSDRKTRHDI